jgi:hypothetical protein
MGKRLRCRLGSHKWVQKHTADNQPYHACRHCGTEDVRGEGGGKVGFLDIPG